MRYLPTINSEKQYPDYSESGNVVLVTFNHVVTEDSEGNLQCQCSGYEMKKSEYVGIQNGMLPIGVSWDDFLHKIFREYQHTRADNMYVYAQRMLRTTSDTKYSDYITALDQWNAQVSATASIHSTDIPDMPTLE